ncbi:MAG: ABC transporter permease subunit [Lachnospiraceae bacterium]|nr:ABC transporter permease subunit [Lachnospiraceae bacterium]
MSKGSSAPMTGAKVRKMISNIFVHVILAILAFIWVLPIFWVVITSFRAEKGSYVTTFFPKSYTINNYVKLFTDTTILNFPRMFKNTFVIAIFTCIISTIFVLSVSYCMSRMRFKMRRPFMNIAMILGLFPGFMSMVAVYYILKVLNMSEGSMIPIALVVVFSAGTGLGFYVAKGFFDTIPKSLDEAAIIDGATRWKIFTNVTIPLSKPIIVYTILTSFMSPWVDFLFAKVICRADAKYYTVSIGLWKMLEKEYIDNWYTSFAAGAVLVSIPIAILFIMTQKFYVEGMSGAVKG